MARDPVDRWSDLGSFIREQRAMARLSLRRLSELAGISNPYLSQIERGLRRPSADILQQIAKALRISAETLYVQAGILDPPEEGPDVVTAVLADPRLGESHKQALVAIYRSFRREHDARAGAVSPDATGADAPCSLGAGVAGTDAAATDEARPAGTATPPAHPEPPTRP